MKRHWTLDQLKSSNQWERSIGKDPGIHFRNGKKHAVVKSNSEVADIHYDDYAAHENPIKHLVNEAPLVSTGIGVVGLAAWSHLKK